MCIRVLIVDEDEDFSHAVVECVRGAGHDASTAQTPSRTLSLIDSWRPHLIIIDLGLPCRGEELARVVRTCTEARVLLYSSQPVDSATTTRLRSVASSVLPKDRVFWAVKRLPPLDDTRTLKLPRGRSMSGHFDAKDLSVAEILSGFAFNEKTGVLRLFGTAGERGSIAFRDGAPCRAECESLEGAPAIRALLGLESGRFHVAFADKVPGARTVTESFGRLILEHARDRDETRGAPLTARPTTPTAGT